MSFEERRAEPTPAQSTAQRRIRELGLKIEGSPIEPLIQNLYKELAEAGVALAPPCFLADEWGCPDGVPAIGIPFYLVDRELAEVEKRETEELENEEEIKRILRHESGHAFCYSHKLYVLPAFRELFGPFSRPYIDDFQPMPFSRAFVRHLPGWYAQKHPDEDFAETFAVFVTPGLDWRKTYAGWPAMKKLNFIAEAVEKFGKEAPQVVAKREEFENDEGLELTLPEHYQLRKAEGREIQLGELIDGDLTELFGPPQPNAEPAVKFLRAHRRALFVGASYWTGARSAVVRGIVDHIEARVEALGLTASAEKVPGLLTSLSAFITTLVMNHLMRGKMVEP
jgi:hypothetical protein